MTEPFRYGEDRWITCDHCGERRDTSSKYTSSENWRLDREEWLTVHRTGACSPQRIGPIPGMPLPSASAPLSRAVSSQAGIASLRVGTPLSGAHSAPVLPDGATKGLDDVLAENAHRTRRRTAGWPPRTGVAS